MLIFNDIFKASFDKRNYPGTTRFQYKWAASYFSVSVLLNWCLIIQCNEFICSYTSQKLVHLLHSGRLKYSISYLEDNGRHSVVNVSVARYPKAVYPSNIKKEGNVRCHVNFTLKCCNITLSYFLIWYVKRVLTCRALTIIALVLPDVVTATTGCEFLQVRDESISRTKTFCKKQWHFAFT